MTQSKSVTSNALEREWQLGCYDIDGVVAQCVIDTDHGTLRIGLTGALEKFFELRAEQVGKFRVAFDKAIMAMRVSVGGEGSHRPQLLQCYSNYRQPRVCSIQPDHGALRITCVDLLTGTQDCFFELRAEQIGAFRAAFNAALEVFRTGSAMYSTRWAEESDDDSDTLSPIGDDTLFTAEINTMVTEEAPHIFALVEEIEDRVDAEIIAWGMAFPDHVEIISAGSGGVRGVFRSAQRAQKLFSVCNPIRLVWVTAARTHYPAQAMS